MLRARSGASVVPSDLPKGTMMRNKRRMITRGLAVALASTAAAAAAGCQSDSEPADEPQGLTKAAESESPDFAAADLKGLNFVASDVPEMEYQPESSGLGAFSADQEEDAEEEGDRSGLELLERLEEVGLEANYVSQFFATSRDSELGFVESIAFLFEDEEGATEAVEIVAKGAARNIAPSNEIDPPAVGEQAFGIQGEFDGFRTYAFGWRAGDVIQLFTVAPSDQKAGPEVAAELGEQLAAKAQG